MCHSKHSKYILYFRASQSYRMWLPFILMVLLTVCTHRLALYLMVLITIMNIKASHICGSPIHRHYCLSSWSCEFSHMTTANTLRFYSGRYVKLSWTADVGSHIHCMVVSIRWKRLPGLFMGDSQRGVFPTCTIITQFLRRGLLVTCRSRQLCNIYTSQIWLDQITVSQQAYFALHKTLRIVNFEKKIFCDNEVAFEAFLSSSRNLKVTRLQGGPQTKFWTYLQNFELSRSFKRFVGLVHGIAVL